jgi:hypothetical protein
LDWVAPALSAGLETSSAVAAETTTTRAVSSTIHGRPILLSSARERMFTAVVQATDGFAIEALISDVHPGMESRIWSNDETPISAAISLAGSVSVAGARTRGQLRLILRNQTEHLARLAVESNALVNWGHVPSCLKLLPCPVNDDLIGADVPRLAPGCPCSGPFSWRPAGPIVTEYRFKIGQHLKESELTPA